MQRLLTEIRHMLLAFQIMSRIPINIALPCQPDDMIGSMVYFPLVGAVVGATHPAEAASLRAKLPHTFFLIPGYGAQGANAEMLKCCFGKNGLGGVVNNSRGIICAYKKTGGTYYEAARAASLAMKKDLSETIGRMGK